MSQPTPLHDVTDFAATVRTTEAGWDLPAHFGAPDAEYRHALDDAVVFDLSHRGKIELVGPDALRFLHNLCSNDIARLPLGDGCEALLANAKAKVISRFIAYRVRSEGGVEDLWLDMDPGLAEKTLAHLDRFLISEQVELADRTSEFAQIFVAGPKAAARLESAAGETLPSLAGLGCSPWKLADARVQLRTSDRFAVPGFDLVCPRTQAEAVWKALLAAGIQPAGLQTYHVLRVEAGTPLYGQDIDENNLAMELGRTAQAISYTKGCFPGQEPIVRARDLGHVNWSFCGLKVTGNTVPELGAKLFRDGKEAGRVTSAVRSPRAGQVLALGYVRRGSETSGTRLELDTAAGVEVSSLPFVL